MANENAMNGFAEIFKAIFGDDELGNKPTAPTGPGGNGADDIGNYLAEEGSPKTQKAIQSSLNVDAEDVLKTAKSTGETNLDNLQQKLSTTLNDIAQFDPSKVSGHYGKDTIKNDPYGNLNNLSYEDTLASSRQADALNNMVRRDPVDIGHRTNSSYGSQGINFRDRQKNEGIETQEMRQMRMNEQLAQQRQSQIVSLLGDLDKYPLELRKKIDDARMQVAQLIATNEANLVDAFRTAIKDLAYVETGRMSLEQAQQKFLLNLSYHTKFKVGQKIYQLWRTQPELARVVGQYVGMGDISAMNMALGNSQVWRDFISKLDAGERDEAYRFIKAAGYGLAVVDAALRQQGIGAGFDMPLSWW